MIAGFVALGLYDFDRLVEGEAAAAQQASAMLTDLAPANAAMSAFYAELLGLFEEFAVTMQRVLSSSFRDDKGEFKALHRRVQAARQVVPAAAGADAPMLAHACDQLDQWLDNLERLTKPTKKDLGLYAGAVTCVAFCVVLVVVAAVNRAFSLGASGAEVFAACAPMAVLAGFGLTGLRAWRGGGADKE